MSEDWYKLRNPNLYWGMKLWCILVRHSSTVTALARIHKGKHHQHCGTDTREIDVLLKACKLPYSLLQTANIAIIGQG